MKRITRDGIIFTAGLGGAVHEVFFTSLDRPTVLIICATMMGLPAFLRFNGK